MQARNVQVPNLRALRGVTWEGISPGLRGVGDDGEVYWVMLEGGSLVGFGL